MNKHLMDIVEQELAAFRERGGDDLVAEYIQGEEDVEDNAVYLFRRTDKRKHAVGIQDGTARGESYYGASASGYETKDILGITCTSFDHILHCDYHDPKSKKAMGAFRKEFADFLDTHKGQFEPIRDVGVAVHPNSPRILEVLVDSLPADGSVTVRCNAVPELLPDRGVGEDEFDAGGEPVDDGGDDCFTFHDAEGNRMDLWMVTSPGIVNVMDSTGEVGRFGRWNDFQGMKEFVEAALSRNLAPAP